MEIGKDWFDDESFWKEFYNHLFHDKRMRLGLEEIPYIEELLEIEKHDTILDLNCGPGRHSIELAKRGYRITGVDLTKFYLDIAKEKAEKENLQIEFIREDMRNFIRYDYFNAIINLYTSFGYFKDIEDDKKVLKNMYKSLKKGGKIILDLMGKEILARIYNPRDWSMDDDGNTIFLQDRKICNDWSWIENTWTIIKDGKVKHYDLSHRLYSAKELKHLLTEAGFKNIHVYGDFNKIDYDQNAKRLIIVANK
jgi:SAM-dependent methyltransferase